MGLIENEILKDQILFFQTQSDEIRGKIARTSKFRGQLRVKLKKFKLIDLFAKCMRIQGPNLAKIGLKLKKLEVWMSIEDGIENIQDQGPS